MDLQIETILISDMWREQASFSRSVLIEIGVEKRVKRTNIGLFLWIVLDIDVTYSSVSIIEYWRSEPADTMTSRVRDTIPPLLFTFRTSN